MLSQVVRVNHTRKQDPNTVLERKICRIGPRGVNVLGREYRLAQRPGGGHA